MERRSHFSEIGSAIAHRTRPVPRYAWNFIGTFVPEQERAAAIAMTEETPQEQNERYEEEQARITYADITGSKNPIFDTSPWTYNLEQLLNIMDVLGNSTYDGGCTVAVLYVYDVIPFLYPEYLEDTDRELALSMEGATYEFSEIGQNLLSVLPETLMRRFVKGLRCIYNYFPTVDPSVINYLILLWGEKLEDYQDKGSSDLFNALAERDIPIKRVRWMLPEHSHDQSL